MPSSVMADRKAPAAGLQGPLGHFWQITPRVLTQTVAAGGEEAKRAFTAMMQMKKIDIAAIVAACKG